MVIESVSRLGHMTGGMAAAAGQLNRQALANNMYTAVSLALNLT
jgi:hypothetical protein